MSGDEASQCNRAAMASDAGPKLDSVLAAQARLEALEKRMPKNEQDLKAARDEYSQTMMALAQHISRYGMGSLDSHEGKTDQLIATWQRRIYGPQT